MTQTQFAARLKEIRDAVISGGITIERGIQLAAHDSLQYAQCNSREARLTFEALERNLSPRTGVEPAHQHLGLPDRPYFIDAYGLKRCPVTGYLL